MSERPKVIIIGAGFAGLKAARALANKPVDVLLIDRNNYHTFTPLLYQVATCGLDPSAIAFPVRTIFRGVSNVHFLLGNVTSIDTDEKVVHVDTVREDIKDMHYDYLFVATGSVTNYFGNEQIENNSFGLRDMNDAVQIRHHILRLFEKASWSSNPNERDAYLTMVVVGGGPTGLETAGALYELYNRVLAEEYSKGETLQARVILLEALDNVLAPFPEGLRKSAKKQLESIGVEVHVNAMVDQVHDDHIVLKDGTTINTHTVVWATGVVGSPVARMLDIELARGGRIPTEHTMEVIGLDNVYAAGDTVYLEDPEGNPYPGLIPVAQQQGELVAKNILNDLAGKPHETFTYRDRGIMATIGRSRAVAHVYNRIPMSGYFAWAAWLILHLVTMLGMRNRIQTLINWTWDYFFYDRSVRIIVDEIETQREPKEEKIITPEEVAA